MSHSELELVRDGMVVRVIPVGPAPLRLGRDLSNDVVLADEDVSGHHAVLTLAQDGLMICDLRSTNGTFVNGIRVGEPVIVKAGDEVRVGADALFRLRLETPALLSILTLHDLTAGVVHAIDDERVRIGSAEDCAVRVPDGPRRAATLMVQAGGEVWLGTADGARPLAIDETFEAGGHTFRLGVLNPGVRAQTLPGLARVRYAYALWVSLQGPSGARARLRRLDASGSYEVTAENRATLLYVLGRRLQEDRARGADDPGWVADEELVLAVWGKSGLKQAVSNYSVLLHRLRKELDEAGFDPWFLEKRRGAIRLRLEVVEIEDSEPQNQGVGEV